MTQEDGFDEVFDVEEYHDVCTTYVEAKNRMNVMRTSQGFHPVVAMVPGGPGGSPSRKSGKGAENLQRARAERTRCRRRKAVRKKGRASWAGISACSDGGGTL